MKPTVIGERDVSPSNDARIVNDFDHQLTIRAMQLAAEMGRISTLSRMIEHCEAEILACGDDTLAEGLYKIEQYCVSAQLSESQFGVGSLTDLNHPEVRRAMELGGIPEVEIEAARRRLVAGSR